MNDSGNVSVGAVLGSIASIKAQNLEWLRLCRDIARNRLPKDYFDCVPPSVWRFHPWGSRVVLMRTPQVTRQGSIVIPDSAQRQNAVGWVLTVGPEVCIDTHPTVPSVCPYRGGKIPGEFDPLLLVGEMVMFQWHAVQELTINIAEERFYPGGDGRAKVQLVIGNVGSIFGPNVDPQEVDWAQELPRAPSLVIARSA